MLDCGIGHARYPSKTHALYYQAVTIMIRYMEKQLWYETQLSITLVRLIIINKIRDIC